MLYNCKDYCTLSNAEVDDDVILDWEEIKKDILNEETEESNDKNDDEAVDDTKKNIETNYKDEFTYESQFLNIDTFQNVTEMPISWPSIRYFAGYVLFKMQQRIPCSSCKELMVKQENLMVAPSELLIHYKNYSTDNGDFGMLLPPTDVFFSNM